MTGTTLAAMDYVPRALLKYLGMQLQCTAPDVATLRALYRVTRTLYSIRGGPVLTQVIDGQKSAPIPTRYSRRLLKEPLSRSIRSGLRSSHARRWCGGVALYHGRATLRIGSAQLYIGWRLRIVNA